MAEGSVGESGSAILESEQPLSRVDAVKRRIKFARESAGVADAAFGDRSTPIGSARKQRTIPANKKAQVSVSDTGTEDSKKVKGKPPVQPKAEVEEKRPVGRPRSQKYPTLEDSRNQAAFLLSALEVVSVTAVGPNGEMTEWERGFIQAPLQRIIQRIPLDKLQKGGLIVDIGFCSMGLAIYSARISQGIKLPKFGKGKEAEVAQDDRAAPVAAPVVNTVPTTQAGDKDGLAVPIPTAIATYMNGQI